MKTKLLITVFCAFGALTGCADMRPHAMDMSQAVQNAKTKADHERLAEHYEDESDDMQEKVDEHKRLLEEYQHKSYLFGKQGEVLRAHCQTLISAYERAVQVNREMAEAHRELAQ